MAVPKIIPYDVELRSVNPVRSFDRPKAYTNDLKSVEFQFKILDMNSIELNTATAITLVYMRDGSFFANPSTDVERVGNVFSYLLKENEGNHAGVAQIQLVVTVSGMEFATQLFDFEIINGLETKVAQEVMIYDWTTLTRDARAYIDQFVADEVFRDAQFDNAQFDRNTAFVASQDARTLAFGTEQTNRGTAFTAEQNERTAAFDESESGRTTAETGRVTAEDGRVEAETDRVTEEGNRVTAENNRETAEGNRVTAESGRVTAESARATTFAGYDARIVDMETDVNANATNLVTNGDFSNGTTGWTNSGGSISVVDGKVQLVATAATDYIRPSARIGVAAGHKLYFRVSSLPVGGNIALFYYLSTTYSGTNHLAGSNPSMVSTVPASTDFVEPRLRVDVAGTYLFDDVTMINLTSTFGAGNEPTATQMDRLMTQFPNSWFGGTTNLFLAKWALNELRRLDNEKANKVQEAWITPTLLNGWIALQPAAYFKDQFGVVHLKGILYGGTLNTICFDLPVGYRPLNNHNNFAIKSGSVVGGLNIRNFGSVTPTVGTANEICLDGITFKAEA